MTHRVTLQGSYDLNSCQSQKGRRVYMYPVNGYWYQLVTNQMIGHWLLAIFNLDELGAHGLFIVYPCYYVEHILHVTSLTDFLFINLKWMTSKDNNEQRN